MSLPKLTTLNINQNVFETISSKQENTPHMIIGPMYSGKTSTLINLFVYLKSKLTEHKINIFNSSIDNRYGDVCEIISHDKVVCNGVSVEDGNDLYEKAKDFDVILINEAQFISGLYDAVLRLTNEGNYVIVSGLDMDYKKSWFEEMLKVWNELCSRRLTKVLRRVGFCDICRNDVGKYSKKTKNNGEEKVIEVGGKDMYLCCCEECYNK